MSRAALVDIVVECGADYLRAFSLYRPTGTPQRADSVVAGDRVYFDGLPEIVYSVEPHPTGQYRTFSFREGLWWQPTLTIADDELVMLGTPVLINAAKAAWSDPWTRHPLTTWTAEGGEFVVVSIDHNQSAALAQYVGTYPWDLYVSTLELGWSRLAEGSMTIVVGEARNTQLAGVASGHH